MATEKEIDFEVQMAKPLADLAHFQAVLRKHPGAAPVNASQTPYPWVAALDNKEIERFYAELVRFSVDAGHRRSLAFDRRNLSRS